MRREPMTAHAVSPQRRRTPRSTTTNRNEYTGKAAGKERKP